MTEIKNAIEAVLFAAGDSIPTARLSLAFSVDEKEILQAVDMLDKEYENNRRGIRILRMDNRVQMCSAPEYASFVLKTLEHRKPPSLSAPALETLAIVAYYQPVTRAVIEKMRGVDSSYTVSALQDRGLIEPCGRLEVPGRPVVYATTEAFLRVMGIQTLQQLPQLPESQGNEGIDQLRQSIEKLQTIEPDQESLFTNHTEDQQGE